MTPDPDLACVSVAFFVACFALGIVGVGWVFLPEQVRRAPHVHDGLTVLNDLMDELEQRL